MYLPGEVSFTLFAFIVLLKNVFNLNVHNLDDFFYLLVFCCSLMKGIMVFLYIKTLNRVEPISYDIDREKEIVEKRGDKTRVIFKIDVRTILNSKGFKDWERE